MLLASDVKLNSPLKYTYSSIGAKSQGGLADALGRIQGQARTSQMASGRPTGEYGDFALGQANTMASRGINDTLASSLGQASLDDQIKQQEYERNMALAKRIGSLNAPNNLMMALEAAKGAASVYGKVKGYNQPQPDPYWGRSSPGPNRNPYISELAYE